ncbi:CPCC family cysteine-rich protein [Kribbella sp. VKM Ac-2568]|uniref:CPCC family cysteine-rich protein n=1 Tax=Kribbella sp. VKM Ac-2568 TaxID=2512219 RepID=UPI0010474134
MRERFPCVCCGHLTMSDQAGSFEICPVCFWEDDLVQLRWPTSAIGANRVPLVDHRLLANRSAQRKAGDVVRCR